MINVTKTYLPAKEKYLTYVNKIFDNGWLTNNGPLVIELQERLQKHLNVDNVLLVANGTLALQIAYKLLGLKGDVITTPFTFIATTSSLLWENLNPIYVDIDPETFTLDAKKLTQSINEKTTAIVPTHVFGNACQVENIDKIAKENNLKVIYDAAHAFDVKYNEKSLLSYGDISILSFHATKLFHTIEGGALIINDKKLYEKAKLMINFGIDGPDSIVTLGINAKMNEFQAAMGLSILDDIPELIARRKVIHDLYCLELSKYLLFQKTEKNCSKNYSYFPVLFKDENELLHIQKELNKHSIFPRRYFYPSLDQLDFVSTNSNIIISKDISSRILCLPIYPELSRDEQLSIINIIKTNLQKNSYQ